MTTKKPKRQPKREQQRPAVTPTEHDDSHIETPDFSLPEPFQLPDFIRRPLHLPTTI
jgi:hypothetical protein